jgi:hypothetical protein
MTLAGGTVQATQGNSDVVQISLQGSTASKVDLQPSAFLRIGNISETGSGYLGALILGGTSADGATDPQAIIDSINAVYDLQLSGGIYQVTGLMSGGSFNQSGGNLTTGGLQVSVFGQTGGLFSAPNGTVTIYDGAFFSGGIATIGNLAGFGSSTVIGIQGGTLALSSGGGRAFQLSQGQLQLPPGATITTDSLEFSGTTGVCKITGGGALKVSGNFSAPSASPTGLLELIGPVPTTSNPTTLWIQGSMSGGTSAIQLGPNSVLRVDGPANTEGVLTLQGGRFSSLSSLTIGPNGVLVQASSAGSVRAGQVIVEGQIQVPYPLSLLDGTDLQLNSGSLTTIAVRSQGNGRLNVSGTTSIQDGAALSLLIRDEPLRRFSQLPLILYGEGGAGQFGSVSVTPASRSSEFAILYTQQGVFLTVPGGTTHEDQGCTPAQRCLLAIADAVEETSYRGPFRTFVDDVLRQFPLFPDCCLYQEFVGEPYTDLQPLALYSSRMSMRSVQKQLWLLHDQNEIGTHLTHAWLEGWGQEWKQHPDQEVFAAGWSGRGLALDFGVDTRLSERLAVGIAGNWVHSRGSVSAYCSDLDLQMAGATVYGSIWSQDRAYLDLQAAWSHLKTSLTREIQVPRLRQTLYADPTGSRRGMRAEAGILERLPSQSRLQVFTALEAEWVDYDSWNEDLSSPAALAGGKASAKACWLEPGFRVLGSFTNDKWQIVPELTASFVYNFVDQLYSVPVTWAHTAQLNTRASNCCDVGGLQGVRLFGTLGGGVLLQRDALNIGLRLNLEASRPWWSWGGSLIMAYTF